MFRVIDNVVTNMVILVSLADFWEMSAGQNCYTVHAKWIQDGAHTQF